MTTMPIALPDSDRAVPLGSGTDESRFLIDRVSWDDYLKLLEAVGDHGLRISYLDGMVELMSPGPIHGGHTFVLGRMVSDLIVELNIPSKGQRSTTFKRRDLKRGLEPDECFYLASVELLRGKDLRTLDPLPPPDLVIEVEVTSPLLDKLAIYAGLGVPEIWRYNAAGLTILCPGPNAEYVPTEQSRVFPFLPIDGFREQLASYDPDAETEWFIAYRAWVREVVAPLYHP